MKRREPCLLSVEKEMEKEHVAAWEVLKATYSDCAEGAIVGGWE